MVGGFRAGGGSPSACVSVGYGWMAIFIPLQVEVSLLEVYWQLPWAEQVSMGVVQVLLPPEPYVKNASQHCPPQTTLLQFVFLAVYCSAANDHQSISKESWQIHGALMGVIWVRVREKETHQ